MRITGLVVLTLLAFIAATPAEARPKIINSSGCTVDQLSTPGINACFAKQDDDLVNNRPVTHGPYCFSTGTVMCCAYNNSTGKIEDGSCNSLRGKPGITPQMSTPPNTTLSPG